MNAPTELPAHLGRFQGVKLLGDGLMGRVYLGEQHEPLYRRVAIKVLDNLRDELRQLRFLGECRALARLAHPNVAVLFERGETDHGQPFVAMELVEGAGGVGGGLWAGHPWPHVARLQLAYLYGAAERFEEQAELLRRDLTLQQQATEGDPAAVRER